MRFLFIFSLSLLFLAGCKTATLYDQYGPVMSAENGSFKNMRVSGRYIVNYATPQDIVNTNSSLARTGIPLNQVSSITVEQDIQSESQGGTIFSAIGEAFIGTCRMAAGVF